VLGLSDALVKHALSYFDSGAAGGTARPAGVLRLGEGASFTEHDRTKERIRAESRPHGMLVIEGDAEYMPVAAKLDDSQFVEQRRLAAQEVCRVFRIPGHIELAMSNDRDLCFERTFVRFEIDGLLRSDSKTRAEVHALALDPLTGWMTREEVRRLEDLPPEPGGRRR
jgi:phage portal protein BeeE